MGALRKSVVEGDSNHVYLEHGSIDLILLWTHLTVGEI